ncbi:MAG: hypothetical protein QM278_07820 [Pseudomonadota bacterium]|nr:hypothetical protein [Pseudomonadota bacterium]
MKQNITIAIEKDLPNEGKIIAAQRGMSLHRMPHEELEKIICQARNYAAANHLSGLF